MNDADHEKYFSKDERCDTIDGWIASMQIFKKHLPEDAVYPFHARYDVLYGPSSEFVDEDSEDGIALVNLGWSVDSGNDQWYYFT